MAPTEQSYPTIRQCTICLKNLPFEKFYKQKGGKFGLRSTCKSCSNKKHYEWALANKKKISQEMKEYYQRNKEERKAKSKQYRQENPETYEELAVRRGPEYMAEKSRRVGLYKYGVNQNWFDDMLEKQNFKCGICGKPTVKNAEKYARLCVDHDHSCCGDRNGCRGCVRGLLCRQCNIKFSAVEDLEWLKKSIDYFNLFREHHIVLTVPSKQPTKVV